MSVLIQPLAASFVAEVKGVDLAADLDRDTRKIILKAWYDYQVLRFRGQSLIPSALLNISRVFGRPEAAPPTEATHGNLTVSGFPEIVVISNVTQDGAPIGALGNAELEWHTDMSYRDDPPSGSVLYAVEAPAGAGDTSFLDMYSAFDTLPPNLQMAARHVRIFHSAAYTSAGVPRRHAFSDGVEHPAVIKHPVTARQALYLGRRRGARIVTGVNSVNGTQLLEHLWTHCLTCGHVWTQRWRAGDVLIWDNRCVMHRRNAFPTNERRVMHRTQLRGAQPHGG